MCSARASSAGVRSPGLDVITDDGLDAYMQRVTPKGTRRASVPCAMRPKPRNPTVRSPFDADEGGGKSGELGRLLALSWGPQNEKGDQVCFAH